MHFGISMISPGEKLGKRFERKSSGGTNTLSTGKSKAKQKEKPMVTVLQSSSP